MWPTKNFEKHFMAHQYMPKIFYDPHKNPPLPPSYILHDELFCGMVDRRKAFSLCQRSSPSRISDTPRAGFEPAQNLSSDLVEWSCAVVITTSENHRLCGVYTPRNNHFLEVACMALAHLHLKTNFLQADFGHT